MTTSATLSAQTQKPKASIKEQLGDLITFIMQIIEAPVNFLQRKIGSKGMPWFFSMPSIILSGTFTFLPLALGLVYSFTGGDNIAFWERPWVGLDNYISLLSGERPLFWETISNTLFYASGRVTITLITAMITALTLNRKIVGRGFFRAMFFYPSLLSAVAVALVWQWFLERNGLINYGLESMGHERIIFMLDATWSRFWVMFVGFWLQVGFYSLILLAGLQAIPKDVYEAAEIDGASKWRQFTGITLPMLMPNVLVVTILLVTGSIQAFEDVYVLTNGGGPGTSNSFVVQYIYEQGINRANYGIGSALSVMLGIVLMMLAGLQFTFARRKYG